ncbi:pilus assembly protein PilW [Pseudomonas xanthosomatis]|uniref:PilW family protein n=1 Tax=Pseudomonas xanthosomatis TaxID=2842356 RepID=UPI001C3DD9B3|nr:pilus assembly protein PilW [Pseudomonas xanthosomatis]QXH47701.1 pilus assembly protein PilW [Pseudomonas xanthosomatis]
MKRRQTGLGLIETLLALALAALLLTGASRLFLSAHQAWTQQGAAARLQDDARLVLQRIAEDVRMAGMFGCLQLQGADFGSPDTARAFAEPITIGHGSLTLVGAALPGLSGAPDWTVLTDCHSWAKVQHGQHVSGENLLALPVRRLSYQLRDGSLSLITRSQNASLIDNVKALQVTRVEAEEGERLDIQLTLYDPRHQLEQQHRISVALRNLAAEA